MVQAGAPKRLWDDALEYEAYMISNTTLDIYMVQGELPETVMLGGTSDISQFCENGFYDWVMFRNKPIQYTDKNTVLGRYLVTAIDVGPYMTAKITKGNGEVMHWSTYRGLKEYEWKNQAHISLRKDFDSNIKYRFDPDVSPDDFPDINLEDKPSYTMYDDDTTDVEGSLAVNTGHYEEPAMATGL